MLTYAGNLDSLTPIADCTRYQLARGNTCKKVAIAQAFVHFRPDAVMHLAAKSHVNRSIAGPEKTPCVEAK